MSCGDKTDQKVVSSTVEIQIAGAMKNVMMKGELFGTIDLDTLNKTRLNGLGPVEYLAGEIMILDGNSYVSRVTSDSTMVVEETFVLKAPFFVYQYISNWNNIRLPDSIRSIEALEKQIAKATKDVKRPFGFKIEGEIENAVIHIVNLPEGKESQFTRAGTRRTNQLFNF